MIFSSILALIAVPTYLRLSNNTLKLSYRTHYNMAALNLAESGIEYAVHAIKEAQDGTDNWSEWTKQGNDVIKALDPVTFTGSTQGNLSIYIINYESDSPEVVAKSEISLPNQPTISRYMYAQVAASSSRGLFAYGMLTKDTISASGGVVFDSWDSDPDNDPDTPPEFYNSSKSNDNVAIASASSADGAISLGSSDVYGTAAVGSSGNKGLSVGWGGQVGPKDASEWHASDTEALWAKDPPGWKVSTQTGALTTGFTATFEDIAAPSLTATDNRTSYQLPYTDKQLKSNPWSSWYQNVYVDQETLGAPDRVTILELDQLKVNGGATLRFEGDVIINLPSEGVTTLQVIQGGAIELAPDATLTIYTAGNIDVTGAGLFSQVAPQQLQVWGTSSNTQYFNFLNNGQFSGIIYAPNAEVKVTGNSDIYGSVIGKNITLTGSGSFRYDESLLDYTGGSSTPGPTEVTFIEELTGDERAPYIALFSI